MNFLDQLKFDRDGLIPAIAQDADSGKVLMFAYMNRESILQTIHTQQAVYYSRSRQKLWHKGEESGHFQNIVAILSDCDQDVLLLKVRQQGGIACHTGRESCFFHQLDERQNWQVIAPVLKDAAQIYDH